MVNNVNTSLSNLTQRPAAEASDRQGPEQINGDTGQRQAVAASGNEQPVRAAVDAAAIEQRVEARERAAAREEATARQLAEATVDVSEFIQTVSRSLQISVDRQLGDTVIRVLDTETDELVRQIPSEDLLEIARFLRQRSAEAAEDVDVRGLLLDSEL